MKLSFFLKEYTQTSQQAMKEPRVINQSETLVDKNVLEQHIFENDTLLNILKDFLLSKINGISFCLTSLLHVLVCAF